MSPLELVRLMLAFVVEGKGLVVGHVELVDGIV